MKQDVAAPEAVGTMQPFRDRGDTLRDLDVRLSSKAQPTEQQQGRSFTLGLNPIEIHHTNKLHHLKRSPQHDGRARPFASSCFAWMVH
jgi:hypothetical protein